MESVIEKRAGKVGDRLDKRKTSVKRKERM